RGPRAGGTREERRVRRARGTRGVRNVGGGGDTQGAALLALAARIRFLGLDPALLQGGHELLAAGAGGALGAPPQVEDHGGPRVEVRVAAVHGAGGGLGTELLGVAQRLLERRGGDEAAPGAQGPQPLAGAPGTVPERLAREPPL